MNIDEFNEACTIRTIAPSIALEDDEIRQALCERNDDAVYKLLDTNF